MPGSGGESRPLPFDMIESTLGDTVATSELLHEEPIPVQAEQIDAKWIEKAIHQQVVCPMARREVVRYLLVLMIDSPGGVIAPVDQASFMTRGGGLTLASSSSCFAARVGSPPSQQQQPRPEEGGVTPPQAT